MDTSLSGHNALAQDVDVPVIALDVPIMYEDEGQDELGETDFHFDALSIFRFGVAAHLAGTDYRVFSDLNLYYHPIDTEAYVSPDDMVVKPARDLGEEVTSYRVERDGPPPELTAEVLSKRSAQQQDTTNKPEIYSFMGVAEFVLIDVTGKFLPQRLLLKRLEKDGSWTDLQDADGGVTSRLGFRLRIDGDGRLRIVNSRSGEAYPRPDEAERERLARQDAEAKLAEAQDELKALRAELQRLRKEPRH